MTLATQVRCQTGRLGHKDGMSIRQLFLRSSLWGLGLCAAGTLPAQTPQAGAALQRSVTLQQALQAAGRNPDVAMAGRALEAARADVLAADHAPLPVLSAKAAQMDLQNGLGSGPLWGRKRIDKSLGLDWTWERGGKRALRTAGTERQAEAAQADMGEMLVQQQLGAQAAFFDLLAAQQRLQDMQALSQSADELARSAERRLQAGDLSAQDAARTRIEAQRARADLQAMQLERQQAALALGQWMGSPGAATAWVAEGAWPGITPMPTDTAMENLLEQRPDVVAARARLQAAQAAYEGALALRSTDPTLGASLDHFPGTSTRLLELRVQFPLRWGYRHEGEIGRALAQQEQAREALDKTWLVARHELAALLQGRQSTAERLSIYEQDILPRARQVAEQAELAYRKGGLPLTDLLDARRTLRTTLIEATGVRTEHAKATQALALRTQTLSALPVSESRP